MKNSIFLGLALCFVAGGALRAQTTIAVKSGTKYTFAVTAKSDVTQSLAGQEMTVKSVTDGTLELAAKKVTAEQIDWAFGLTKAHLKVNGSMLPKPIDSTIRGTTSPFSTDRSGRVTLMPELENDLQSLTSGGFMKTTVDQVFSPLLKRALKPGDSWEETSADTVENPAIQGLSMMMNRTIKYTYDGIVDTLKKKMARVRAELTSMSIEGSGKVQGMDMVIDGDGTSLITNYYDTENGILFATTTNAEINARISISGGMDMIVPMAVTLNSTMVRKGK
jgi:hypothetical protein